MQLQKYNKYDKKQPFIKKRMNVCFAEILDARNQRQTRPLAAYYLLKTTFQNSCIFNYRRRIPELSARLGISQRTVYNYLRHLGTLGLVYAHKDNLILASTRKTKAGHRERKKYQITITDNETIETIEARLMGKVMENHARRIEHYKRIRRYESKFSRRRDTDTKDGYESGPVYSLSIRNLERVFNLGRIKTSRVIGLLNEKGVIRTMDNPARAAYKHITPRVLRIMEDTPGYHYAFNGQVYVRFGNRHEIIEYPPAGNPLSYRQYIMFYKSEFCKKRHNLTKGY